MNDHAKTKCEAVKQLLISKIFTMNAGNKLDSRNDLAAHFGVARTTIDRAISELIGEGYLSSTKGSGTFVLRQSDYSASALHTLNSFKPKSNGTKTIALLTSNIISDIYPHILRGVEEVISRHGMDLVVCRTNNDTKKQEEYIRKLARDGIAGFVIVPAINGDFNANCLHELEAAGIPFVTCYRTFQGMYAPGVFCNSFQSGYICTEHLIKHGCKRIAYISAPLYATAFDRYQGYLLAHENYSMKAHLGLMVCDNYFGTDAVGARVSDELLTRHPEVDGIFAFNDRIAVGVYATLQARGLLVGRDVKIVSCDNTSICNMLPIKLTSAQFPVYEVGEMAAKYLIDLINDGVSEHIPKNVVSSELVIRESCGCVAGKLY